MAVISVSRGPNLISMVNYRPSPYHEVTTSTTSPYSLLWLKFRRERGCSVIPRSWNQPLSWRTLRLDLVLDRRSARIVICHARTRLVLNWRKNWNFFYINWLVAIFILKLMKKNVLLVDQLKICFMGKRITFNEKNGWTSFLGGFAQNFPPL